MESMDHAKIITTIAIVGVGIFCYFLAIFPPAQTIIVIPGAEYIYITPYLEPGPAIALFIGLLSFIGAIFINFYTTENSKKNVLTQLKHGDEKKSLIKLRIMLDKLNQENRHGFPTITREKIAKKMNFEAQNKIDEYFYEEFIELFEKFKESEEYYNYYYLPKKFRDIIDSTIDKNYEFPYENKNRGEYSKNLEYLKNLIDNELNSKY